MSAIEFKNAALTKHRDLATLVKSNLTVAGSVISEVEASKAYDNSLPDGLTPELVKELSKHNARYIKASAIAVTETAAEAMLADKSIDQMTAKIGFNAPGDAIEFSVDRQRTFPIPRGKDEPKDAPQRTTTKHLHVERTLVIGGTSIKSVTSAMSEEFRDTFAK